MTRLLPLALLLTACGHRISAPLPSGAAYDTAALVYGLRPDLFPMDTVFVRCHTGQDARYIECLYVTEGKRDMQYRRVRVTR